MTTMMMLRFMSTASRMWLPWRVTALGVKAKVWKAS